MKSRPSTPSEPSLWRQELLFAPPLVSNDLTDEAGKFWRNFRSAHPYGLQGVAISKVGTDGRCSVVVSEPPPHVRLQDLKEFIRDARVMRMPVGHDGALFDVVGTLRGGQAEILRTIRLLSLLLFHTDYGAYAYIEPFRASWKDAARYPLDIQPTAPELNRWLNVGDARFEPVEGGAVLTHSQMLRETACGVYRLSDQGVLVWLMPAGVSISDCLAEIRIFALAGDLIIGAVKESGSLLILARQRTVPYHVLSPLRTETIALLAAVQDKDELQQSYQRNQPGAGPYTQEFDWAPILLSPELVDSEYGNLLNMADQLLKGWSELGKATYERFAYPSPRTWPFEAPLSQMVNRKPGEASDDTDDDSSNSVTFNWNTTGAGYTMSLGGTTVYAPYRTGALPVSYIPGEDPALAPDTAELEDTAYRWYAELNNPMLTRVVQYAALYQAFHNLGIGVPLESPPKSEAPANSFAATMKELWHDADVFDESKLDEFAKNTPAVRRTKFILKVEEYFGFHEQRLGTPTSKDVEQEEKKLLAQGLSVWRDLAQLPEHRTSFEEGASSLAGSGLNLSRSEELSDMVYFISTLAAHKRIADKYAASIPATSHSWIHTPAVVMSSYANGFSPLVGGHNVNPEVVKLAPTSEIEAGTVQIRDRVLQINPADASRAHSVIREAARGLRSREAASDLQLRLSSLLREVPLRSPRPPATALKLQKVPMQSPGILSATGESIPIPPEVMRSVGQPSNAPPRISFVKHQDHIWVSGPGQMQPIVTSNLADASEIASLQLRTLGRSKVEKTAEFHFLNLPERDREVIMTDVRLKGGRLESPREFFAVIGEERTSPLRSLKHEDYDFRNPKIRVEKPKVVDGEPLSKVVVEFQARRPGIANLIVEVWVRIKGAISETQVAQILKAIEIRAKEIFGIASERNAIPDVALLHQEIRRIERLHKVKIETHVTTAAGNTVFAVLRWAAGHA